MERYQMRKYSMFTRKALIYLTAGIVCGIVFMVIAGDGPETARAQEFGSESADIVYTSGTATVGSLDYTPVVNGPLVLSVSEFTYGYSCEAAIFEGGCSSLSFWNLGKVGTARSGDVLGPNEVLCIAKADTWGTDYCNYRYAGHFPYYYVSGPRR
jgi:hypothetical protein